MLISVVFPGEVHLPGYGAVCVHSEVLNEVDDCMGADRQAVLQDNLRDRVSTRGCDNDDSQLKPKVRSDRIGALIFFSYRRPKNYWTLVQNSEENVTTEDSCLFLVTNC